jgi:hypothetical protein
MDGDSFYPIEPSTYEALLNSFNIGSSIAENDPLLETAKIETQEFWDLYNDTIDLVRGVKGSGKTALFRVFYFIRKMLLEKKRIYVIQGVEAMGDPVFKYYQKDFESFDELKFQNFWRIYFINLIINNYLRNPDQFEGLKSQNELLRDFYQECTRVGIPTIERKKTIRDVVEAIITFIKYIKSVEPKVAVKADSLSGQLTFMSSLEVKTDMRFEKEDRTPIFVNNLRDILTRVLENCDLRIWIMLDRLDEVFLRRTPTEVYGLRALLKSAYSFSNPRLRVKVFLRDDIIEAIISDKNGFTGLTHVGSRSSGSINWSKDQILHLIVKRIFSSHHIAQYFQVDASALDRDKSYREVMFYKLFPIQIKKGKRQPLCLDWMYKRCQDSKGIVTPRDVIDLIDFAKQFQYKIFKSNPQPQDIFISHTPLIGGLEQLSLKKKDTYLRAEFPHFWNEILKFQNGRTEHNKSSLKRLFGKDWKSKVDDLQNIGFIRFIPSSDTYKIPIIWRHGLNIKQGKAF